MSSPGGSGQSSSASPSTIEETPKGENGSAPIPTSEKAPGRVKRPFNGSKSYRVSHGCEPRMTTFSGKVARMTLTPRADIMNPSSSRMTSSSLAADLIVPHGMIMKVTRGGDVMVPSHDTDKRSFINIEESTSSILSTNEIDFAIPSELFATETSENVRIDDILNWAIGKVFKNDPSKNLHQLTQNDINGNLNGDTGLSDAILVSSEIRAQSRTPAVASEAPALHKTTSTSTTAALISSAKSELMAVPDSATSFEVRSDSAFTVGSLYNSKVNSTILISHDSLQELIKNHVSSTSTIDESAPELLKLPVLSAEVSCKVIQDIALPSQALHESREGLASTIQVSHQSEEELTSAPQASNMPEEEVTSSLQAFHESSEELASPVPATLDPKMELASATQASNTPRASAYEVAQKQKEELASALRASLMSVKCLYSAIEASLNLVENSTSSIGSLAIHSTTDVQDSLKLVEDVESDLKKSLRLVHKSASHLPALPSPEYDSASLLQSMFELPVSSMQPSFELVEGSISTVQLSLKLLENLHSPLKALLQLIEDSASETQESLKQASISAATVQASVKLADELVANIPTALRLIKDTDLNIRPSPKLKEGQNLLQNLSIQKALTLLTRFFSSIKLALRLAEDRVSIIQVSNHAEGHALAIHKLHQLVDCLTSSVEALQQPRNDSILAAQECPENAEEISGGSSTPQESPEAIEQLSSGSSTLKESPKIVEEHSGDSASQRQSLHSSHPDTTSAFQSSEETVSGRSLRLTREQASLIILNDPQPFVEVATSFLEQMSKPVTTAIADIPEVLMAQLYQPEQFFRHACRELTDAEVMVVKEVSASIATEASEAVRNLKDSLSAYGALQTLLATTGKSRVDTFLSLYAAANIKCAAEEALEESADVLADSAEYLIKDNPAFFIENYLIVNEIVRVHSSSKPVNTEVLGLVEVETIIPLLISSKIYLRVVLQCIIPWGDTEGILINNLVGEFHNIRPGNFEIFMSLGSGLHYKPHGLPQREIDHLPCRIFSRSTDYRDIKHCFICNCRFKEGEELKLLDCLHELHPLCAEAWLRVSTGCPDCRHVCSLDESESLRQMEAEFLMKSRPLEVLQ